MKTLVDNFLSLSNQTIDLKAKLLQMQEEYERIETRQISAKKEVELAIRDLIESGKKKDLLEAFDAIKEVGCAKLAADCYEKMEQVGMHDEAVEVNDFVMKNIGQLLTRR